ncbi:MAG: hypothetical protein JWN95_3676 [Frankiales bacterium]|nr:hypothetical protein [Frankiales bacterium]
MADEYPIRVRRIYGPEDGGVGVRVLVDRLWPRGVSRERARLTAWCRDVAPSAQLRTWYGHQEQLFDQFRVRYLDELTGPVQAEALDQLRQYHAAGPLVLLTATKATQISNAAVLSDILRGELR